MAATVGIVVVSAAVGLLEGILVLGRAAAAWEEWGLANMSSVMPTIQSAAIHSVRAGVAVAALGLPSLRRRISRLRACKSRVDHIDSVRRATRRR